MPRATNARRSRSRRTPTLPIDPTDGNDPVKVERPGGGARVRSYGERYNADYPAADMDDSSELDSLRAKRMAQMQSELGGVSEVVRARSRLLP